MNSDTEVRLESPTNPIHIINEVKNRPIQIFTIMKIVTIHLSVLTIYSFIYFLRTIDNQLRGFLVWSVFTAIRNSSTSRIIEESATGNTCRNFVSLLFSNRRKRKQCNEVTKITKEGSRKKKVSIGTSAQSGSIDRNVVTLKKVKVGLKFTECRKSL